MLSVRKANITDAGLINKLAAQVFPETYKEILTPEQLEYMFNWMYSPENIRKQMEDDGHIYFIVYKDQEPCGYYSIQQEQKDLFHLQKIYVLPGFQGSGIGKYLIEQAIQSIKQLHPGPCMMELNVNRHNKAVQFYKKMGLKVLREGDFHIGNGFYMNDYIMGMEI